MSSRSWALSLEVEGEDMRKLAADHREIAQSIQFLRLTLSSSAALSAEVLFLHKQLAFYSEHQISPRKR